MSCFLTRLRAMISREDGGVAIMTGLLMTIMVPGVIAAVDLTNISNTREATQSRLDSALVAATRFDDLDKANQSGDVQKRGERFLLNALEVAGIDTTGAKATFEYDKVANLMRGRVEVLAPTIFAGKVFDLDTLVITSEIIPKERIELEVALSLDISGSMEWAIDSEVVAAAGSQRIDALREGVAGLVKVFDDNPLVTARMSVVPYSSSVNISATTQANSASNAAVWVTETAERQGNGKLKTSMKPPKRGKSIKFKDVGTPLVSVLPLSTMDVASDFVGSLSPNGGTAGHIGAEWALYSLLPDWQEVWKHPKKAPSAKGGKARKILVIMTDGDFTVTHTEGMTTDDAYEIFQDICLSARDAGVIVYAVGLSASQKTDDELSECAGSKERYFSAADRAGINDAFRKIGESATRMRISR